MLIKNKSLSLLAKIAFCVVSFFAIILLCRWLMWGAMDLGAEYFSPTSLVFVWTGIRIDEFLLPLIPVSEGSAAYYISHYIYFIFSDIWFTMSVTIYCSLYAMLAQKLFFGDAFKKEYYKPKNFFNIYIKILLISRIFTRALYWLIGESYSKRPGIGWVEIYGFITVFLVYKAIGLARKKSQAAPLQTAAI